MAKMKTLIFSFLLSASFLSSAFAGCELTAEGRAAYRSISLEGCGMQYCVRYTSRAGKAGFERMKPAGCNDSTSMPNCYSVSPSFIQVFMSGGVEDSQYLGSRDGGKVFLICRFPR